MECELCGRPAAGKARIEGTIISVCAACARFGQPIYEAKPVKLPDRPRQKAPEEVYFVNNLAAAVKNAREGMNLTREELAGKIREKSSVIERIEKGSRPEKHVVEKLERFLGVQIISSVEAEKSVIQKKSSIPLTLGDIVTIKKRKKQFPSGKTSFINSGSHSSD